MSATRRRNRPQYTDDDISIPSQIEVKENETHTIFEAGSTVEAMGIKMQKELDAALNFMDSNVYADDVSHVPSSTDDMESDTDSIVSDGSNEDDVDNNNKDAPLEVSKGILGTSCCSIEELTPSEKEKKILSYDTKTPNPFDSRDDPQNNQQLNQFTLELQPNLTDDSMSEMEESYLSNTLSPSAGMGSRSMVKLDSNCYHLQELHEGEQQHAPDEHDEIDFHIDEDEEWSVHNEDHFADEGIMHNGMIEEPTITSVLDDRFNEEVMMFKKENETLRRELEMEEKQGRERKEIDRLQKIFEELKSKMGGLETLKIKDEMVLRQKRLLTKNGTFRLCFLFSIMFSISLHLYFRQYNATPAVPETPAVPDKRAMERKRRLELERKLEIKRAFDRMERNTKSKLYGEDADEQSSCGCPTETEAQPTKTMTQSQSWQQPRESLIQNYFNTEQYPWLNTRMNKDPTRTKRILNSARKSLAQKMESILRPTENKKIIFSEESAWLPGLEN